MVNIAVIGGGVIGITSALQVQKDVKNCKVTVFAEKVSPDTTGDLSAGFWTPYLLEKTPQSDITRWSKVTHDKLQSLWKAGHAEKAGICLLPAMRLFTDENIEQPEWLSVPYGAFMFSPEKVQKLKEQHGVHYTGASHYVTYTCESKKLLPMLMQEFFNNGGNIIRRKINNLSELSHYDIVINCAGLEARGLVHDTDVHAIRGQISRVKAPWQFQIISDESDDGYYIIPNTHYVILGGTHQVGNENLNVDLGDKERILEGCAKIAPGMKTCNEYLDGVGLRPGRSAVRIDVEQVRLHDGKTITVVNNYGHGGAGVTLSFGCALEASKLVQQVLQPKAHL